MHNVYLIRHGKSSLDGEEAERGLEREGIVHAGQIARKLISASPAVAAIYSSPYRRAQLTAAPLGEALGLDVVVVADFREKAMSSGPIEDLAAERVRMWQDFDRGLPGGESNTEAQARAIRALEVLKEAHPDEAVAVASHGTLIALMLNAFDPSFGYEAWRSMPMPDIFRIDYPVAETPVIDHVGVPKAENFMVRG